MSEVSAIISARPAVEVLAQMLDDIQEGRKDVSIAPGVGKQPSSDQTLVCLFNFEPRLRYLRYIVEFNRLLNEYTEYNFDVYSIRRGCIDVCYYSKMFSSGEKNTVRRQIIKLVRDYDIAKSFHISQYILFGRHYSGSINEHTSLMS
ncbi:hypothetical protein [Rhizobium sp. AN69]|uniref:hypothetical protein n=2 Tax=Rhizobium TaxID=379 RepID=UPI002B25962B|nr:hypothetical protein [Rhizobium sp. AN69]